MTQPPIVTLTIATPNASDNWWPLAEATSPHTERHSTRAQPQPSVLPLSSRRAVPETNLSSRERRAAIACRPSFGLLRGADEHVVHLGHQLQSVKFLVFRTSSGAL